MSHLIIKLNVKLAQSDMVKTKLRNQEKIFNTSDSKIPALPFWLRSHANPTHDPDLKINKI